MPTEYSLSGATVDLVLNEAIKLYHPDLLNSGTKVGIRCCSNPDGDAVSHAGYPAYAKVSIVPTKWRLSVPWDAVIEVDQTELSDMEHASRLALFNHECSHLEVVSKKNRQTIELIYKEDCEEAEKAGEPMPDPPVFWRVDYLGRPKLKIRKADVNVGDCFARVIELHGPNAIEAINISKAYKLMTEALEKYAENQRASGNPSTLPINRKAL